MANVAEPSSAVVVSVRLHDAVADPVDIGWSGDDQPGTVPRHVQGWTGRDFTRLSTQTLRDTRSLEEVLVDEVAGEILARSVLADLPKSEMRHALRSAREFEPREDDAAIEVDGTSTAGVVLPPLATPVGVVSGAAVRYGEDTIVVIHDGVRDGGISLRTSAAVDDVQ